MTGPQNATTTDNGRTYEWPPTGETFTSVTTIIKGGTPMGWGLQKWLKTVNVRFAVENHELWMPLSERDPEGAINYICGEGDRFRDNAAIRGTDVHEWAERIVLGTAQGEPPEHLAGYVQSFVRFLEEWKPEYEATEATVYSRSHGFAGTLDFLARIEGHGLVLGDYKTKPDGKTIFGDIALQLNAYAFADFIGLPDGTEAPLPNLDGCLALVIKPSSYDLIPVALSEELFRDFLYVKEVRRFATETTKSVLGKKLRPPPPKAEPVGRRAMGAVNIPAMVD